MIYCPQINRKGNCVMEITMRYVRGHVEVYTTAGQFLFAADTEAEAAAMLEE